MKKWRDYNMMMSNALQKAKDYVNSQEPDFLDIANDGKSYVCPNCGNGTGNHGTGLSKNLKTGKYRCFRCGKSYDIVDLVASKYGLTGRDAFKKAYDLFGVKLRGDRYNCRLIIDEEPFKGTHDQSRITKKKETAQEKDFSRFVHKAKAENDYAYLSARGISKETQDKFLIGFVPNFKIIDSVAGYTFTGPRCIIPTSRHSFLARETRSEDELNEVERKWAKRKVGAMRFMNYRLHLIKEPKETVFVVEGEIDALSVEEVGFSAIGLGSTSRIRDFCDVIQNDGIKGTKFIFMMDNDEAGRAAEQIAAEKLSHTGITFEIAHIPNFKDANEWLCEDREGFRAFLERETHLP